MVVFGVCAAILALATPLFRKSRYLDDIELRSKVVTPIPPPEAYTIAPIARVLSTPVTAAPAPLIASKPNVELPIPQSEAPSHRAAPPIKNTQPDTLADVTNMSPGDRDRLTNAFFEFSQMMRQANELFGKANLEGGQLHNAWERGAIVGDANSHIIKLRAISVSAMELAKTFVAVRQKWNYYANQETFIFGSNPDNEGPNVILGATDGYARYLESWVASQNKDTKPVLDLFRFEQDQYDAMIGGFSRWQQGCNMRLEQMKDSIR
jgi:hypothetical protein